MGDPAGCLLSSQWRVILKWIDNNAQDVAIGDYH